ncbi:hypothetical protein [Pseudomonas sp. FW305-28]|uniref:hypothetical protein n=1 Tax=Pseudomonas sp. FW305-28 TaxID=2751326 RepID=UPI0028702617|nr:hypothetical protein [Pseudomonas sp. FW305-28]
MDYPKSVPSAGLVNGKFVDENPLMGTPGSLIPARWGNSVTDEVLNVIDEAGLNPNEADSTQLIQAIRRINQAGSENHAQDNGAANIYTVAYLPALSTLVDGMVLRFKAKTANTGASTFSPNDLSAKPIVGLALSALQAGEIVANGMCSVVWSATLDKWVLLSCTGGGNKGHYHQCRSCQIRYLSRAIGRFTYNGYVQPFRGDGSPDRMVSEKSFCC